MCGIIGVVSSKSQDLIGSVIDPLERLEYRGYDSCGVAYVSDDTPDGVLGHPLIVKSVGDVSQLRMKLKLNPLIRLAIAHTRWATHGQVSLENTHPHVSHEQVYIVHNGVIDNSEELREKLIEKGYTFTSETDTEVIAHLIYAYRQLGYDLPTSVSATLRDLKGKFSFAAIDKDSLALVAVKQGRPLIVYRDGYSYYISSDVAAFSGMAKGEIYFPRDGSVIEARAGSLRVTRDDVEVIPTFNAYTPEPLLESQKLRTLMETEIYQQHAAIFNTLEGIYLPALQDEIARPVYSKEAKIKLIGCGTSYHAAMLGASWLKSIANVDAVAEISSEFASRSDLDSKSSLFVLISQSGETADTLAALDKICADQLSIDTGTLAICNVEHSELVRRTALHLPTRAGVERSVASTKAFTAQLAALLKLSLAIANRVQSGIGSMPFIAADLNNSLSLLPDLVDQMLISWDPRVLSKVGSPRCAFFLGRGNFFPIAHEGALKFNEIVYIPALAYSSGELKHGPLALIDVGIPVFTVFNGREAHLERLFSSLSQIESRGGVNYLVTDSEGFKLASEAGLNTEHLIKLPTVSRYEQYLSPFLGAIAFQLIAHEVALSLGNSVDKPRNLAKSVTVE